MNRIIDAFHNIVFHPRVSLKSASEPMSDLLGYANQFRSDKGTYAFGRHNYVRVYDELFEPIRSRPLRVLEVGLLHISDKAWANAKHRNVGTTSATRAPSLQMWSRYFHNADVFGFDINDFSAVKLERCRIFRGDMGERADLERLIEESGGDFDIIIEDASHASHHQQIALAALFPSLKPGGLYIIEDLAWQPSSLERPDAIKTVDVLRRAEVTGKFESPFMTDPEAQQLEASVAAIEMYDSLSPRKALLTRDSIAVLRKRQ